MDRWVDGCMDAYMNDGWDVGVKGGRVEKLKKNEKRDAEWMVDG